MIADLMALFYELMSTILTLVTRPFSICKLIFMFGLRTMFIVINTWVEILKTSINVHLNVFHKTIIWMIALITLPARVLTALQRERLLQGHLHEMQIQLEGLSWERKELWAQIQTAIEECRILETMIEEVEDENDSLIAKIELLEGEMQDLKAENLQLKEILRKDGWSYIGHDAKDNAQNVGIADTKDYGVSDGSPSCYKESRMTFEELLMRKDAWESKGKNEADLLNLLKKGSIAKESIHSFSQYFVSRNLEEKKGVYQRRDIALSQSIFSAVLSLLVGIIIWEAKDPCMPLVMALFTVVGMSLKSVVQFFSTIKNKPASDAVALLSVNWFILGALTYPALPRVVRSLLH